MKIHYAGAELVFKTEQSPIVQEAYLEEQKKKVVFYGATRFCIPAVCRWQEGILMIFHWLEDPAQGWGWLAQKGFDIIQTDWAMHCVNYLRENNYRK